MATTNYKQLKQKTFSDGKAEDKIDIYPVIGFDESAFTGSQTVILPINHGGTGASTKSGARNNLGIPGKLDELESKLIGNTNDLKTADTINGAKNYAKDYADTVKGEILGSESLADNLNSIYELVEAIGNNADLINSKVNKADIYAYDTNNNISGGKVGNGASVSSGGAIGYNAQAQNGFAGGKNAEASELESVAIGVSSQSNGEHSIAVGSSAKALSNGCSLGFGSEALGTGSAAIGPSAKIAENVQYAVQLGNGTNENGFTLQFRQYQLVNAEGKIPSARLYEVVSTLPESTTENPIPNGTIVFLRQQTT